MARGGDLGGEAALRGDDLLRGDIYPFGVAWGGDGLRKPDDRICGDSYPSIFVVARGGELCSSGDDLLGGDI